MEKVAINPKYLLIQFQILGVYIAGSVIAIFAKLYFHMMPNKSWEEERDKINEKNKNNKI